MEQINREDESAKVIERICWQYGHSLAAQEPAKTSVTALRWKAAEWLDQEAAPWFAGADRKRHVAVADLASDVAKIGTLHHRFLQRMSLDGECDGPDLERQLARMVELGEFTGADSAVLDLPAVSRFWQSEAGWEIRRRRAQVRREVPFTARFSPLELETMTGAPMAPELGDEFVVVQGVADLLVLDEHELWLLDFKTDQVPPDGLAAKCALYRPQLKLYAAALEAIHGRPVTRCWLHFLRPGETVPV
jgi:ATP-dependent helicase/nuclease subunit A